MTTDTGSNVHESHEAPAQAPERPHGDPSAVPTVVLGIVGGVLLLILVVALETLYYGAQQQEVNRKVVNQPVEELQGVRASQLEQLNSYGWTDQVKGAVAIPIERAMELTARDLNAARGEEP